MVYVEPEVVNPPKEQSVPQFNKKEIIAIVKEAQEAGILPSGGGGGGSSENVVTIQLTSAIAGRNVGYVYDELYANDGYGYTETFDLSECGITTSTDKVVLIVPKSDNSASFEIQLKKQIVHRSDTWLEAVFAATYQWDDEVRERESNKCLSLTCIGATENNPNEELKLIAKFHIAPLWSL